ncbi:MAG: DUF4344 domain-containing metallopeptidase [Marinosulfonomonas sp.]|nr:DUF4344 domain-containing metallopeptidase [Marinosulfonomonas sp.]
MKNLSYILSIALLLPSAAIAQDSVNKQVDKVAKETLSQAEHQDGSKQGKPDEIALEPKRFEFVRTNLVSTFYHELAHALIDIMELPVLGQEEDAADVFSVIMVDRLYGEEEALAINGGAARGFQVDAIKMRGKGREWDWADEHGPDMQRYYNIVCLTYGGAPKRRAAFAEEMRLPEDRAEICEDEFALAKNSWDPIIKRMADAKPGEAVHFSQSARSGLQIRAAEIIEAEVKTVNEKYNLPRRLRVVVKRCGRNSNFYAFYSPSREKITVCTNYIDELYRDAPN